MKVKIEFDLNTDQPSDMFNEDLREINECVISKIAKAKRQYATFENDASVTYHFDVRLKRLATPNASESFFPEENDKVGTMMVTFN